MNRKPDGNEPVFPGLRVPEPPEDLRRQVLSRARQVLAKEPRPDLWARIWNSRQARLAWGASVLALTVWHLVMPVGDVAPARERSDVADTGSNDREELAAIVNLPRLSLDARPFAASVRTPGETEAELDVAAPPAESEENAS